MKDLEGVPSAFDAGDLLRRLEGETPGSKLSLFEALQCGPLTARASFLERTGVDVEVNLSFDVCSRIPFIEPSLLPEKGVSDLARKQLEELLSDCAERASALCQSIQDSFYILEGKVLSRTTQLNCWVTFVFLDCFGHLEEWFKFQTTYLSALLLKQIELPDIPVYITRPGFVAGGAFYRTMRQLLGKCIITQHVSSWAMTLVGLKRGALPLRSEKVAESLESHRVSLGKPTSSYPRVYSRNPRDHVYETLEEIVEQVFDRVSPVDLKARMPSVSSHYSWSRAEGGALGRIATLIKNKYGFLSKHYTEIGGYAERSPAAALSQNGPIEMPIYVPAYSYDLSELILSEALKESLDCDVHVVLEPMKARIITSGPPLRYHICRLLQKIIHGTMRQRNEFQLIGGPVDETVLNKNFSHLSSYQRNWSFVSADYKAATDNLDGTLSERATSLISERLGLDEEVAKIYLESMTDHILHYPEEFGGYVSMQRNGQLMGSPSSFPVLCLVNMAALLGSWRYYCLQKRGEYVTYRDMLRELRPLVNGDDLLFIGPTDFYGTWSDYVADCGLKKSPGKNYVSKDFAVINSTYFSMSFETMGIKFNDFGTFARASRVHWVGSGLLKGQARVLADTRRSKTSGGIESMVEANVDFGQLRSQLNWVLDWEEGREEMRERSLQVWFRNMRSVLMAQKRSWRLPVCLGGLELPIGGATRPQLVLANMIIKTFNSKMSSKFVSKPKVGNSTTLAQLNAERDMADSFGMKRYVKEYLPYTIIRVPGGIVRESVDYCPPAPEDLEGNIYADCFDRNALVPTICTMKAHDLSVSPFVVGLTMLESAETQAKLFNFDQSLMDAIKHFNGGPVDLEEACRWVGTTCWGGSGTSHFLPNPKFSLQIGAFRNGLNLSAREWLLNECHSGEFGDFDGCHTLCAPV